jgi:hypothetical protein
MRTAQQPPDIRCFCVVVHDVSPLFRTEIDDILRELKPLVGRQIGGAVVPAWHGCRMDGEHARQLQNWGGEFGEVLLHGSTHYRDGRTGLISWLTGRSDEFSGMSLNESIERLKQAQVQLKSIFGSTARGFVPPAWQFPYSAAEIHSTEIGYILRLQTLESAFQKPIKIACWSWDWGWLPGTCRLGAMLGRCRQIWYPQAIPVIVLHPADVRQNCVAPAIRLVQRLLRNGYQPVLPGSLVSAPCIGVAP